MKPRLLLATALLLLWALIAACGGGGGAKSTPSSSEATSQAALNAAKQTPISDSIRAYAKQLCSPVKKLISDAGDTISQLQNEPTPATDEPTVSLEDAFTQGFALLGQLKDPIQAFDDSLHKIAPPEELRGYHQSLLAQMDYAVRVIDAVSKNGLAGAFALPTQEATPQEPSGLEPAILQECGEDLQPFIDQFGGNFFGGGAATATPAPPPPGAVGRSVTTGNFELLVDSVTDPYVSTDEFYQPDAGKRWVLIDVSLTNASKASQDYGSFDFKLRDTDNFSYDPGFVNQSHDLSSGSLLAGETIRGELGFVVPQNAQLTRLVYEPGFGAEGRIDIDLR